MTEAHSCRHAQNLVFPQIECISTPLHCFALLVHCMHALAKKQFAMRLRLCLVSMPAFAPCLPASTRFVLLSPMADPRRFPGPAPAPYSTPPLEYAPQPQTFPPRCTLPLPSSHAYTGQPRHASAGQHTKGDRARVGEIESELYPEQRAREEQRACCSNRRKRRLSSLSRSMRARCSHCCFSPWCPHTQHTRPPMKHTHACVCAHAVARTCMRMSNGPHTINTRCPACVCHCRAFCVPLCKR